MVKWGLTARCADCVTSTVQRLFDSFTSLLDIDMTAATERASWRCRGRRWQLNCDKWPERTQREFVSSFACTRLLSSLLRLHFSGLREYIYTSMPIQVLVRMQLFYWAEFPNCLALQVTSTSTSFIKIRTCTEPHNARNPSRMKRLVSACWPVSPELMPAGPWLKIATTHMEVQLSLKAAKHFYRFKCFLLFFSIKKPLWFQLRRWLRMLDVETWEQEIKTQVCATLPGDFYNDLGLCSGYSSSSPGCCDCFCNAPKEPEFNRPSESPSWHHGFEVWARHKQVMCIWPLRLPMIHSESFI